MAQRPIALNFAPGVQRDGTKLDSLSAVDALWCRWRLGRPRKMRGYSEIADVLAGPARRIHMFYQGSNTIIHVGTSQSLQQIVIDANGNLVSTADRTPLSFAAGPDVGWTLDAVFDTTSDAVQLIAHAVPDLTAVGSDQQTTPFLGLIDSAALLGPFTNPGDTSAGNVYTQPDLAGGIVAVQPFVFGFDAYGLVQWSAPNLPNYLGIKGGSSGAGSARISAQKIVAGMPLRGGGAYSPAALFWSLSEVIVASYVGSPAYFSFNTVSPSSSILSNASVIEYDGLYFWAGIDRFLVYNGTVVEVPNPFNQDWFFDNMNWDYAGKSFAFKVPRYGEIWWCAPLFGATEPSHAVIYNVREKCWYDTVLPNGGRGAGFYAQGFRYPVMGGVALGGNGYSLWLHEKGTDQIKGGVPSPVRSYYETPYLAATRKDPPTDDGYSIRQVEPDITQTGDLDVLLVGTFNPRVADATAESVTLPPYPAVTQEELASFKSTLRLPRLHFESNVLGGSYITGRNILHVGDAKDMRITSGKSAATGSS